MNLCLFRCANWPLGSLVSSRSPHRKSFMHRIALPSLLATIALGCAQSSPQVAAQPEQLRAPIVEHHQHIFSPPLAALVNVDPIDADKVVALLDSAGIRRALVLALGYSWGNPGRNV